jgi:hypothetical protein
MASHLLIGEDVEGKCVIAFFPILYSIANIPITKDRLTRENCK